jgi:ribonuclease HI
MYHQPNQETSVQQQVPANKNVVIYSDGACSGNPGPGGWGAVLIYADTQKEIYGSEQDTTNNRMEMKAACEAMKQLKLPCVVNLHTDSKYLKDGITSWIINWKKNNWQTAAKQPVKNMDLWLELDEQIARHEVHWHWVKAHNGNEGNELADKLAVKGKIEAKENGYKK